MQVLRYKQVAHVVGRDRVTVWRWVREGAFPQPVKIGRTAVAFDAAEVDRWLDSRRSNLERAS
jgi:prophage regulatory protein